VEATQPTPEQLKDLQTLHIELTTTVGEREKFFEVNERFHMRLLEIANNRWRDQMVADLRKVMKLNRHNSLLKSGRLEESLQEHQAIMDALLARNAALSAQCMTAHFANGLEAAS